MKTEAGKLETYFIDRRTGTAHKVLCAGKNSSRNRATVLIKQKTRTTVLNNLGQDCRFDHSGFYSKSY